MCRLNDTRLDEVLIKIPLVEGTTGWNNQREEFEQFVNANNGSFVFGANFSVGVNLFYRITDFASELFAKFEDYEAFIEEQHHSLKKDDIMRLLMETESANNAATEGNLSASQEALDRALNIYENLKIGF